MKVQLKSRKQNRKNGRTEIKEEATTGMKEVQKNPESVQTSVLQRKYPAKTSHQGEIEDEVTPVKVAGLDSKDLQLEVQLFERSIIKISSKKTPVLFWLDFVLYQW